LIFSAAFVLDVVLLLVDGVIAGHHFLGQAPVAFAESANALVDDLLDGPGHGQQMPLKVVQVAFPVLWHDAPPRGSRQGLCPCFLM
jgi:hypothetical protein